MIIHQLRYPFSLNKEKYAEICATSTCCSIASRVDYTVYVSFRFLQTFIIPLRSIVKLSGTFALNNPLSSRDFTPPPSVNEAKVGIRIREMCDEMSHEANEIPLLGRCDAFTPAAFPTVTRWPLDPGFVPAVATRRRSETYDL